MDGRFCAKAREAGSTEGKLSNLFDDIASVTPTNERESAIYREAFMQLNELVSMRRDRMSASRAEIPPGTLDRRPCRLGTYDCLRICIRRLPICIIDDLGNVTDDRPVVSISA